MNIPDKAVEAGGRMSRGTKHRTIRIEDGLWDEAKATAKDRGDNLSEVIRQALIEYNKPLEGK